MKKVLVLSMLLLAGCASVPMEKGDAAAKAKQFAAPTQGMAGLYIYRLSGPGGALKKDIRVDGKCVGESAQNVFFYEEVAGNQEHTISTESEFSPNDLRLTTAADTNYFVQQSIKMGVFVGGAKLTQVDEAEGKARVSKLDMAVKGYCSK